MKLTAPVYVLKRRARELKRLTTVTLAEALDQIARVEGYHSWSLLQSKMKAFVPKTTEDILEYLNPGDLVLVGARPGLGKTTLTLQLLSQAIGQGRLCFFFSLEYTHSDVVAKLSQLDATFEQLEESLKLDFSDEISSDYVIDKTSGMVTEGSLIAIDYLQLLDQQRNKPSLQMQVEDLKKYAKETKSIFIFISQIDRTFDQQKEVRPSLADVRLPNPLDLGLFNKSIFVQDGQIFI